MQAILRILLTLTLTLALGLALPAAAQQPAPDAAKAAEEAKRQRERAIERCKANRGTDCATEAGLQEWLLEERSRSEAEAQHSRSIHQTAPVVTPRPGK